MEHKLNLRLFLLALSLAVMLLIPYEMYWKSEGWAPGYDMSADMWAYWRGEIEDLGPEDVVIIGSSRSHFDLNIHLWDSLVGRRPVMLSIPGGSPYYVIEDIVEKSSFRGLLVVGVANGLFFTLGNSYGASWIKGDRIDYYYKQTSAQQFSQWVYRGIDPWFSYTDPEINLKSLINRIPFEDRDSIKHPPAWIAFVGMDQYRFVRMVPAMETDTAHINRQTRIWGRFGFQNPHADSIEAIFDHYLPLIEKYKQEGGRIAFINGPITGGYLKNDPINYPRDKYWDRLIRECKSPGYHFQDYPETNNMDPPEWSHLNRKESDIFTRHIIKLLKQDKLLE